MSQPGATRLPEACLASQAHGQQRGKQHKPKGKETNTSHSNVTGALASRPTAAIQGSKTRRAAASFLHHEQGKFNEACAAEAGTAAGCTCALNVLQPVQGVQLHAELGYAFKQRLEVCAVADERGRGLLLQLLRRLDCLRHEPRVGGPERGSRAQQIIGCREQPRSPLQSVVLRDRNSAEAELAAPYSADSSSNGAARCPCSSML